jgi:propanol-preferring alcohol dehydrogenase
MKAMILKRTWDLNQNNKPLELAELPDPTPGEREILVRVSACGVCHTELDEIEGRLTPSHFPIILGHQVIGRVEKAGNKANKFISGDRVGIAWVYSACGKCKYCQEGKENLCSDFRATGKDANGGYASYITVREDFAYPIPDIFTDVEAAPLLCAGAIGYRSVRLTNLKDGQFLGLTGFGASAHIVLMLVKFQYPNTKIFVFSRSEQERVFAKELGATWVGDIDHSSPLKLDCIIDTTPAWRPVLEALRNLAPDGRLVINAIRKEEMDKEILLKLDYTSHLWMEKEIKSVANVSRNDVSEFLGLAARIPIKPEYQEYFLEEANLALLELKNRKIHGAKVLKIN